MGVHAYKSVDSKQYYRSLDALVTGARVRLNNVESWFRARPPFQRGVAVGLAAGLLIAFVVRYLLFQVNAAYLKGFELQTGFPEQCSLGVTRTEKGTEAKNDLAWDSPVLEDRTLPSWAICA